jgi:exodeoxyribonuclease VII small subunit
MARRKSEEGQDNAPPPSFEEALAGLEAIVEAMEHENLPLEDLVGHYEKGAAYLSRCESILQTARGRIELITLRNQSEIGLDAGAEASEHDRPSFPTGPPDDPDESDDIRLF